MGLFSRFLSAAAASLDPGLPLPPFATGKFPFGNLLLTMVGVWLEA
jgi:hypothetical protein